MKSKRTEKKKPTPPPPFSGAAAMPANPRDIADAGEETTRRVQGVAPVPTFNSTYDSVQMEYPAPPALVNRSDDPAMESVPYGKIPPAPAPPSTLKPWTLDDAPTLPEFHPLERTAVFVPHSSASIVASRVSNILRDLSIEAFYDNSTAKAKCLTADNVDFRVRLYRGRNQYSHGIIVEVQRRFGSSINFHSQTMAILDASKGRTPQMMPPPTAALPVVEGNDDEYDVSDSSLDFCAKMFRHPGHDAHNLALQTLSALTDPAKMGRATARSVSKVLLEPSHEVGTRVISLVVDQSLEPSAFGLRLMATTVLSNAIQAVSGNVPKSHLIKLRPVFIQVLQDAANNAQMAYLVAKCMQPLVLEDECRSELIYALETARKVGEARHAALERQATVCLGKLGSR